MKNAKKLMSLFIVICMAVSVLPMAAMADAPALISDFAGLKQAFSNGGEYRLAGNITVDEGLNHYSTSGALVIDGNGFSISPLVTGLDEVGIVNEDATEIENIIMNYGTLTLKNLTVYGGEGRCIFNDDSGVLIAENVTLERAHLTSGYGAGIRNEGRAVFTDSNIRRNGCDMAAGGFLNYGTLIFENTAIVENRNFGSGTGGGGGQNNGTIYMNNTTVANNQSSEIGGGINNFNGRIYAINSTFTGNITTATSDSYGGGIGNNNGTLWAANCIFAYNYANNKPSDIGIYSGNNITMDYCAYGKIKGDTVSASDCTELTDTDLPNTVFNGSRSMGIVDKNGIEQAQKFERPLIVRQNGAKTYGVYLNHLSPLLTGGTKTYYKRENFALEMEYERGSLKYVMAASNLVPELVTKYADGTERNGTVLGALSDNMATYFVVTIVPGEGGTVSNGSSLSNTYLEGSVVEITAIPDYGFAFLGWKIGDDATPSVVDRTYYITSISSDIKLTPVFKDIRKNVTLNLGGGTVLGTLPSKYVPGEEFVLPTASEITKENAGFGGWYDNPSFTGEAYTKIPASETGDVEFWAKWIMPQTLSFQKSVYTTDLNGNVSNPLSGAMTTVTYESSNLSVATVDSATGEVTVTGPGKTTITATAAQTDEYSSASASYELTITKIRNTSRPTGLMGTDCTTPENNDGKITGVDETMEYRYTSVWTPVTGSEMTGLTPGPYEIRYKETDTHTASDYTVIVIDAFAQTSFKVTFDAQGGTVSPEFLNTQSNGLLSELPVPTKSRSYTFDGWYTQADGGTKIDTDYVFTSDTTVYAHWTRRQSSGGGSSKASYVVSFNTNGGNDISSVSVSRNDTLKNIATPKKDGCTFEGWYKDKELTEKFDLSAKIVYSMTLYAKWSENGKDDKDDKKDEEVKKDDGNKNGNNEIILYIGKTNVVVFGEEKTIDVCPLIRADRTMLPARFVAESLGAEVLWSDAERKVTIKRDDIEIVIFIDSDKAYVNGEEILLDSPAFLENDRTYTPVRFVAEKLGGTVYWDESVSKVTIVKQ